MPFVCECGSEDFYTHHDEEAVVYVNGDGDVYDSGDVIDGNQTWNYPYKCCECDKEYSQIPPMNDEAEWIASQKRTYLTNTNQCPICGSGELEGGSLDTAGNQVYQTVNCIECDATWTDIYYLKSVEIESYPSEFVPQGTLSDEDDDVPNPNDAFKEQGESL